MGDVPQIFDRRLRRARRWRTLHTFGEFAFVAESAATEIGERLATVQPLARAAFFGAVEPPPVPDVRWIRGDEIGRYGNDVLYDEERLPFAAGALDLYVSVLSLHAVNDLPGALVQIRRCLAPGGLFMAALFGGRTLEELRVSLAEAEIEIDGGLSPRIAPFVDVRDAGALLQRAGFAEPVADVDTLSVHYRHPLKLLADLRGMGETNVLVERRRTLLKRRVLQRACEIYLERHCNSDGRVRATFDVLYLTGRA